MTEEYLTVIDLAERGKRLTSIKEQQMENLTSLTRRAAREHNLKVTELAFSDEPTNIKGVPNQLPPMPLSLAKVYAAGVGPNAPVTSPETIIAASEVQRSDTKKNKKGPSLSEDAVLHPLSDPSTWQTGIGHKRSVLIRDGMTFGEYLRAECDFDFSPAQRQSHILFSESRGRLKLDRP